MTKHRDSDVLGRYTAPAAPVQPIKAAMSLHDACRLVEGEELRAAYQRIDELERMLGEARLQIQYLHEKFQPTGSGEATLARIDAALLEPFPAESGA